jgi:hypothetical protein
MIMVKLLAVATLRMMEIIICGAALLKTSFIRVFVEAILKTISELEKNISY